MAFAVFDAMGYNQPIPEYMGKQLEQALGQWAKDADLGLQVQVELISHPSIFAESTDICFKVATLLQEPDLESKGELPFKIRLKALYKTLITALPEAYPKLTWQVPNDKGSFIDLPLTIKNMEDHTVFEKKFHHQGSFPHYCRFRIRAIETIEARLARK